ncbi:MAG: flagellar biosynthesis protein FlhF [Deltaproteobacteria bacterium]|nr:flagellar biosynthesis protein FlhF [Deltaproteobacteria bacterium]
MRVKTFTGSSTKDVMAQIKNELGPDAIILSNQKTTKGGTVCYEIMAALDEPAAPAPASDIAPAPAGNEWTLMREEWSQLRKHLMAVITPQMDVGLLTPRQQVVLDYLEREGVHHDVLLALWEKFRRQPDSPTLSVMSGMLKVLPWLDTAWPHKIHLFAGPYGGGKSCTVLRLSLAVKKARPKTRILIVNADRSQGKGRLYLRHYAELSGLSYRELDSPEQWADLERDAMDHDLVLVDLPGLPGRQPLDAWLRDISGGHPPKGHVHLVLSPLYASGQMDAFVSRLATDSAASIIWTKLDEACNYGEILNQATKTGLPVSLLSVGPELKNTLAQPDTQGIWKLLLRHELPEAAI